MYDNSPFYDCSDDELKDILPVLSRRVGTKRIISRMIAQSFPFSTCTDYAFLTQCITNKDKIL